MEHVLLGEKLNVLEKSFLHELSGRINTYAEKEINEYFKSLIWENKFFKIRNWLLDTNVYNYGYRWSLNVIWEFLWAFYSPNICPMLY